MARPADNCLTLDDLYRLPNDDRRHELSRGYLVSEPPTCVQHGRLITSIVCALGQYVQSRQSGVVVTADAGFVLSRDPDTVRAPDVAYVRRERYTALRNERGPFYGPPDLPIEVLSPSDRRRAVKRKIADYLDNGTPIVWVLDPERQDARMCRPGTIERIGRTECLAAPELLPGFALPLAPLYRRPWAY